MADTNSPEWQDQDNINAITQQTIMDDVTNGTLNIQSKGTQYLPKYWEESSIDYNARLANSELLPTTDESIKSITGKLLSKPTQFNDIDIENNFDIENIDGMGSSFKSFESQALLKTNKYGMTLNLIDFPNVETRTKAQERADNIKPFFKTILASQIINKRTTLINGKIVLSQVTIKESVTVNDGDFGVKSIPQYRVYRLEETGVSVTVWQESDKGIAVIEEPRMLNMNGINEIPLVPMYSGEHSYMTAVAPYAEMAQLNLNVYRLNSGHKRNLHEACNPTPVLEGDAPRDVNGDLLPIVVGASSVLNVEMGGSFTYASADPSLILPVKEEIQIMKDDMAKIASEMTNTETDKTATEVNIDDTNNTSKLMQIALSAENCWNKSKEFYYGFLGVPDEGEIIVNKDFSSSKLSTEEVKNLQNDLAMGNISHETYLNEMQKGEHYTTIEDIEVEAATAKNQMENQLPVVNG